MTVTRIWPCDMLAQGRDPVMHIMYRYTIYSVQPCICRAMQSICANSAVLCTHGGQTMIVAWQVWYDGISEQPFQCEMVSEHIYHATMTYTTGAYTADG
jgi:hypothetical protein